MKRSILFLPTLIGLTITMPLCTNLTKEEPSTDIGCVVYVKNPDESGNLIANWAYSQDSITTVVGTGYTTESPKSQDFEGEYKIHYTGKTTESYNLIISQKTSINSHSIYKVEWHDIKTGSIVFYGTGIVKDSQLIVGWRK